MSSLVSKKQMRMMLTILAAKKKTKTDLKKTVSGGGVGIVVETPSGILMGRNTANGLWSLPGGNVESGESHEQAAIRETFEETGLSITSGTKLDVLEDCSPDRSFYIKLTDTPEYKSSTDELESIGFFSLGDISDMKLRSCSAATLAAYSNKFLHKSKRLKDMLIVEKLNKNIIRHGDVADVVYELSHGDALKLVGNGTFRIIRDGVKGMENDSIKDIKFGTYTLHIRKHANDIYSGRIDDGLKTIHQFINRSIPTLTAELMSVFEWYSDDKLSIEEDDKLKDETITDGISKLVENYKKHNISDIHSEIENIREEIRNGSAVDIQQAEQKIMKLFDKLEETVKNVQLKHNDLANRAGDDIDELERKLRELQSKVDSLGDSKNKTSSVSAVSSEKVNHNKIHDEFYGYLSKPKITIEPNGRITIGFESDWEKMDKVNFLSDMKAKVVASK